ncbi:MAG: restriction endonuclease PLD domain-containing protein [Candidatus Saccharimonadales bacterium]
MYTNIDSNGGGFLSVVEKEIQDSVSVCIASGYTSLDIINRFKDDFERIVNSGGEAKLLLGMAFFEGLSANKLSTLEDLARKLSSTNDKSNVFVTYKQRYHGKVYMFDKGTHIKLYVGSSNFSRSGLIDNIECTVMIKDKETTSDLQKFIAYLFDSETSTSILKAEIAVPGSSIYLKRVSLKTLDDLQRYDKSTIDVKNIRPVVIPLARLAETEKSNLNVYFGEGRWNNDRSKVLPRPWYEIEVITQKPVRQNPDYPIGEFEAYTDDGYVIKMYTGAESSDYKNIRSKGNLKIFGMWLKGKLQKANALIPLTPVTTETLDLYGNDELRLYKLSDRKYYMEF